GVWPCHVAYETTTLYSRHGHRRSGARHMRISGAKRREPDREASDSMNDTAAAETPEMPTAAGYALWQLVRYMLGLGTWGFGGPVALVGYMYRDLVEKRGWISESDYKEGMALAQLMPGPLAAQLALYLGYVHYRIRGATLAGLAFVRPSFF